MLCSSGHQQQRADLNLQTALQHTLRVFFLLWGGFTKTWKTFNLQLVHVWNYIPHLWEQGEFHVQKNIKHPQHIGVNLFLMVPGWKNLNDTEWNETLQLACFNVTVPAVHQVRHMKSWFSGFGVEESKESWPQSNPTPLGWTETPAMCQATSGKPLWLNGVKVLCPNSKIFSKSFPEKYRLLLEPIIVHCFGRK